MEYNDLNDEMLNRQLERRRRMRSRMIKKRVYYAKLFSMLLLLLGFFVGIIVFIVKDISLVVTVHKNNSEEKVTYSAAAFNPAIDVSLREEIEKAKEEEELQNSQIPEFVSDDNTKGLPADVISQRGILIDLNTNKIVESKEGKSQMYPASMTKIMTVLVAAEHVDNLDDTFTVTKEINYFTYKNDCSAVGFADDETVTVRDLFYGTILPSGADAAVSLATYVAGDQDAFVELMNQKCEELGIAETTHFTNCVGLYDDNNYSTCYDMALILYKAINNDLCKEVLSAHKYTTSSTPQHPEGIGISNWFLRRIEDKDSGGVVQCAKTGFVVQSKNCAASFADDDQGNRYICVTTTSDSSWKCIYDHVKIYRSVFPGHTPGVADDELSEPPEDDSSMD